jgi:hypothetical protein
LANTSRIGGFKPVYHTNGSPYNGQATRYFMPSTNGTAAYVGDLVKLAGSADTDGFVPTVTQSTAGDVTIGAIVAVERNPDNLTVTGTYRAASTDRYVWVADATDLVYEAEVSNGTPAATDIGLNVNHAAGSASTAMGRSGAYVDFGTEATTAALTLKLRRLVPRPDNEVGASAKVHVTINNHQFNSGTGTDGV